MRRAGLSSSLWTVILLALSGDDLVGWVAAFVDRLEDAIVNTVQEAVDYGEDTVKEIIQSEGTGRSWDDSWDTFSHATPGRYQSAPGRVASGRMAGAVDSSLERTGSGNVVVGSFGWLGDVPGYFLAQEGGYKHNISGAEIEGMYAIHDAGDLAFNYLNNRLGVVISGL